LKPTFLEFTLPIFGKVEFAAHLTMLIVGFLVAILLSRRHAERIGVNGDRIVDLGILMLVAGVLGARILSVLTDGHFMDFVHLCTDPRLVDNLPAPAGDCVTNRCPYDYLCDAERMVCHPPRDCLAALKFWQGGLTYYGGFLLALAVGIWYARRKHLGVLRTADIAAPVIMLGMFFGRMGCFFSGCCYGAPTDSWIGVKFPQQPGPVHPTQLYEASGVLVLFCVLYFAIWPRKRGHGEVFGWLLVLYGTMRWVLELFRADERGSLGPLSTSQIISIPLVIAGAWLIIAIRKHARAAEAVAAAEGASDSEVADAPG
jgi:phosphatidylglycerol:prolipoprotein diacylglycerol transferase